MKHVQIIHDIGPRSFSGYVLFTGVFVGQAGITTMLELNDHCSDWRWTIAMATWKVETNPNGSMQIRAIFWN